MNPVPVLVCACGKRLKAAGAVPGRVGSCPACGARFQVPDGAPPPDVAATPPPVVAPLTEEVLPIRAPVGPSAYVSSGGRKARSRPDPRPRHGLIRAPEGPETRLRDSFLYPFWGETGLALLAFMPPAFWITSLPLISVAATLVSENASTATRLRVAFLVPMGGGLVFVIGFTLLYLGRVLVASSLGEVHHPRWPDWDLDEMLRGAGRWFWGLAIGVVIGGFPALVYWLSCGDIDPIDAIVFAELLGAGALYAQMAILVSILHDDPLGANPVTVLLAIRRIGWGYARPCLVSGFALVLIAGAFLGLFAIDQPVLGALALWAFWVLSLYLAMVMLRVLGLCYHRRARALGWFIERPRWGA